jgi:hypothetical protein
LRLYSRKDFRQIGELYVHMMLPLELLAALFSGMPTALLSLFYVFPLFCCSLS